MVTRCAPDLFTIGHSNHPLERFLDLLRRHGIGAVADVRSRPYSRFVPHFSKERLQRNLVEEGIDYLYLGQELGGRPPRGEAPAPTMRRGSASRSSAKASPACSRRRGGSGSPCCAASAIRSTVTACT
jgi:hypothetical protein